MFLERMRLVVPVAIMAGRCAKRIAASKASGVRSLDLSGDLRMFASEASEHSDFGSYARAAAEFLFARRSSIVHIQSVQTTAIIAPASAIPPAPLSDL